MANDDAESLKRPRESEDEGEAEQAVVIADDDSQVAKKVRRDEEEEVCKAGESPTLKPEEAGGGEGAKEDSGQAPKTVEDASDVVAAAASAPEDDHVNGDDKREEQVEADEDMVAAPEEKEKDGVARNGEVAMEAKIGPKVFTSSKDMFNYFYELLHGWPMNFNVNKYEHMMLEDLLNKGHQEPDKKVGAGIQAFQVRINPEYHSRCYYVVRIDGSVDDFSYRKCVDNIMPLPEDMKSRSGDLKFDPKGHNGGRRGGGRFGGGRGGGRDGRGRGFRGRGRGRF